MLLRPLPRQRSARAPPRPLPSCRPGRPAVGSGALAAGQYAGAVGAKPGTTRAVGYVEWLRVSWWMWPVALGTAAGLAAEIHLGARGLRGWVPYAVLLPVTAALLWW